MDTFNLLCFGSIMFGGVHGLTYMRWNPFNAAATAMLAFFAVWPGAWLAQLMSHNLPAYAGFLNIALPVCTVIIIQAVHRRLVCRYLHGDTGSFIWY